MVRIFSDELSLAPCVVCTDCEVALTAEDVAVETAADDAVEESVVICSVWGADVSV